MTNREEREEVAKKLRKLFPLYRDKDIYQAVLGRPPIDMMISERKQMVNRLADLIDPTCKVENAGEVPLAKESLTTWFCSECGSPIYNDMQPSYCIYCGARVVRDA